MTEGKEKPIETAIRFLEWHIVNDYHPDSTKGIPRADWYNLKRFIEILKELSFEAKSGEGRK